MHTVHRLGLWQSCIHLKDHTQNLSLWVFKQIVAIQLELLKIARIVLALSLKNCRKALSEHT